MMVGNGGVGRAETLWSLARIGDKERGACLLVAHIQQRDLLWEVSLQLIDQAQIHSYTRMTARRL